MIKLLLISSIEEGLRKNTKMLVKKSMHVIWCFVMLQIGSEGVDHAATT